jgi:hypothetical protein
VGLAVATQAVAAFVTSRRSRAILAKVVGDGHAVGRPTPEY